MMLNKEHSEVSIPPTYAPSLVFSHGKRFWDQTFCTLSDGCYHVGSVPLMHEMYCLTSSHGWLMVRSYYSNECYLFNPISLTKVHLPPAEDNTYDAGVLTSSPSDPDCIVMLISNAKKSSIFCHIGDTKFIEQKLISKRKDPVLIKGRISVISCKGKIYLFFDHGMGGMGGMGVVDVHDTFLSIKLHKIIDPLPSLPWVSTYVVYFVESCGEIFQVAESRFGLSQNLPHKCDVFKLDISTMDWVVVDNIGDQIFLLGLYSTSVSATKLGLKAGCIYFCLGGDTSLYRFDMHDGTTTTTLPCPKKFSHWRGPFWFVPNCKFQVKKEMVKLEESTHQGNQEWSWKDLPVELLEVISSFLFLDDCIRFRLTCKSWISITPPLRLNCLFNKFESKPQQPVPWLMSFPKTNQGICKLYHPIYGDTYIMNMSELAGAIIRNAKYGWLLMSQGTSFFFLNPITMEVIKLPDMKRNYQFIGMCFSAPPTSSDFVVFGFIGFFSAVYRKGEETWTEDFLESCWEFMTSPCTPIFYDGVFYCLGKNGRLGLFDPNAVTKESEWRIVESAVFSISLNSDMSKSNESFIVEYDGEILSVFVGSQGRKIWIFKLNQSNLKWDRLESLGDKVLFLSPTASMLLSAVGLKGIENRIYFSRFHESDIMFYSLSAKTYHCCGSQYSCEDWISSSKLSHCTWIQ